MLRDRHSLLESHSTPDSMLPFLCLLPLLRYQEQWPGQLSTQERVTDAGSKNRQLLRRKPSWGPGKAVASELERGPDAGSLTRITGGPVTCAGYRNPKLRRGLRQSSRLMSHLHLEVI